MCNACGFPTRPGHWTDAGADNAGDRLRLQMRRTQILNRLLSSYGFTARPPGHGPGFALSSFTGRTALLPDLEAVWEDAARQIGAPIDPLAPRFTAEAPAAL
ncbi:hypothetical protein HKX23_13030 [Sulfitobacter sp. KE29]|uniref:hypothetical protein n=1 Tax=unclassified Sulfitobacter TaxID=196795 RepID=UPI0007C3F9C2|nr:MULTISPECIES: hypothetical protein [unclassified Sulfitobacter]KZY53021.1 hypothetical protein A3734_17100 [Sulfitobacter sp. HI0054]MBO9437219.1 hypothetical protein [Sulfitobacter sp. R18_2]MDF3419288.1 hypothetical protein [Sulfitobacter sp. Ks38]MDF3426770.1 hypothetical protein [Sulfitobacter sp. KE29]MDF3430351.1 hypothetical protein [Sulfitobacter sp. S46]